MQFHTRLQEAGLELGELEPVAAGWTMPGISTERMHLYLATYRGRAREGRGGVDEDEDIIELSLAQLAALADTGKLADIKTLVLVQTLRLRRPDLFKVTRSWVRAQRARQLSTCNCLIISPRFAAGRDRANSRGTPAESRSVIWVQ